MNEKCQKKSKLIWILIEGQTPNAKHPIKPQDKRSRDECQTNNWFKNSRGVLYYTSEALSHFFLDLLIIFDE